MAPLLIDPDYLKTYLRKRTTFSIQAKDFPAELLVYK